MLKSEYLDDSSKVIHEEFLYKSGGKEFYAQRWDPEGKPNAVVYLVHGLGEHSSRYNHWAERFVAQNISFFAFDLRGHGQSEGRRGYASDYSKLIQDVDNLYKKCVELYPGVPVFIYGHSMGGNLATNFVISQHLNIKGLILTSPWFELKTKPSLSKQLLGKLFKNLLPWLTVPSGLKQEYISRDLRTVHKYKSDDLIHDKISIKLGTQIIKNGIKASKSIYKINSPVLIMHGSDDQITDPNISQEFVRNAGSKTKYIEWDGGFHELHNDLDKEDVFKVIADWINNHL